MATWGSSSATVEQRTEALEEWRTGQPAEALPLSGMTVVDIGSRVWVVKRAGVVVAIVEGEDFWRDCYFNGTPEVLGAGIVIGFNRNLVVVNWRPRDGV